MAAHRATGAVLDDARVCRQPQRVAAGGSPIPVAAITNLLATLAIIVLLAQVGHAAHVGVSWESISDCAAFTQFVQQELMRRVIDVENRELSATAPPGI